MFRNESSMKHPLGSAQGASRACLCSGVVLIQSCCRSAASFAKTFGCETWRRGSTMALRALPHTTTAGPGTTENDMTFRAISVGARTDSCARLVQNVRYRRADRWATRISTRRMSAGSDSHEQRRDACRPDRRSKRSRSRARRSARSPRGWFWQAALAAFARALAEAIDRSARWCAARRASRAATMYSCFRKKSRPTLRLA